MNPGETMISKLQRIFLPLLPVLWLTAARATDTTPPTAPQNVHAVEITQTSASVTWLPSTDNVGVTGYSVYRDGTLLGTSATTNFTDNGPLDKYHSYEYTVNAFDAAANYSAASAAAVFAYHRFPFVMPWDSGSPNSISDLSSWAGPATNWVTATNGHFYTGTNRIRFLGANIVGVATFPSHDVASTMALRLSQLGVNCVRLHQMDARVAPWGIWTNVPSSDPAYYRVFDANQLELLDYFVAQLKQRGIYVDMNLHVVWSYPGFPTDGVPGQFKGIDLYYPGIIAMQKQYASNLLTHVNRYTGNAYVNDPDVSLIEINNEDGLIGLWFDGTFTTNLDAIYMNELKTQWNGWLTAKYTNNIAVSNAWALAAATPYGNQLLTNGYFSSSSSWWQFTVTPPAAATGYTINKGAPNGSNYFQVNVTSTSTDPQAVRLSSSSFSLTPGLSYTINFWAKAMPACAVNVGVAQNYGAGQSLGGTVVQFATNWEQQTVVITATNSEPNACLAFSGMGQSLAQFYIANVAVINGNTVLGSSFNTAENSSVTGMLTNESLGNISILQYSQVSQRSRAVYRDWLQFLWNTESNYWCGMRSYLRDTLGAKVPIIGTQAKYSPSPIQACMDALDFHPYWSNPVFPGANWDPTNWYIVSGPMTGRADGGLVSYVSQVRVAGKPFVCTEYNHSAPNTYATEGFLDIAAYASLQDWDGIFPFDFLQNPTLNQGYFNGFFDMANEPAKLVTFPAMAAMLRRFEVAPAIGESQVTTPTNVAIALDGKTGSRYSAINLGIYGMDSLLSFQQRLSLNMGPVLQMHSAIRTTNQTAYASDTGQLNWDTAKGVLTIKSPRVKAVIGSANQQTFNLGDGVTVTPGQTMQGTNWAAVTLTVLNGAGFQTAGRVLITATGYTDNHRMLWKSGMGPTNATSSVGANWGQPPVLMEGVPAAITFAMPTNQVAVWALDVYGDRETRVPLISTNGGTLFQLSRNYETAWYEATINYSIPPAITLTSPVDGTAYSVTTPVTVAVTPTDLDGPTLTNVSFFSNGNLIATVTQPPYSLTLPTLSPGLYAISATATDGFGRTATSAVAQISMGLGIGGNIPVAAYPLNETSGKVAYDASNNGSSAVGSASPVWQPTGGILGGAAQFTATSQSNTNQILIYDSPVNL
ncbi:MAG TPA: Ig-like domain-containing protein, partial [Verrucomicrobiae bacterium]